MTLRLGLRYRSQSFGNAVGCACHSRPAFLTGVGAVGAAAVLPRAVAKADVTNSAPRTVDVHHHIYPPHYLSESIESQRISAVPPHPESKTGRPAVPLRRWIRRA